MGSSRRVATPRSAAWPRRRRRTSGREYPSHRCGHRHRSSSRHSCHMASGCTMPATAARWGRAPASRRAAIRISAGVRTLTTTAWARAALDDHRGGQAVVRMMGSPSSQRPFGSPRFQRLVPLGLADHDPGVRLPDRGAEPVRQPVQGARPRGRSRPACGRRPRPRRSPPATARPWPAAPRRGSPLRLPARQQAARGPAAGSPGRPAPAARSVPWPRRARPAAPARSPCAGRGVPQGAERHRPPLLRERGDVVLPLCPRRTGQDVR
jgi:hypothetical protein